MKFKLSLLGDQGVGKTSLVRRYLDDSFSDKYKSTIGVKISKKQIKHLSQAYDMVIWDVEGKGGYTPIPKQYLGGTKLGIIVVDFSQQGQLDTVIEHSERLLEFSPDAEILVALSKCDLVENLDSKFENFISKIKTIDCEVKHTGKTSSKLNFGIEELFDEAIKAIVG